MLYLTVNFRIVKTIAAAAAAATPLWLADD